MNISLGKQSVIVGVGESPLGKTPALDALSLQRKAANSALMDAGLELKDVDGLILRHYELQIGRCHVRW